MSSSRSAPRATASRRRRRRASRGGVARRRRGRAPSPPAFRFGLTFSQLHPLRMLVVACCCNARGCLWDGVCPWLCAPCGCARVPRARPALALCDLLCRVRGGRAEIWRHAERTWDCAVLAQLLVAIELSAPLVSLRPPSVLDVHTLTHTPHRTPTLASRGLATPRDAPRAESRRVLDRLSTR